jgi:amino acid adenylation domain-containing protein
MAADVRGVATALLGPAKLPGESTRDQATSDLLSPRALPGQLSLAQQRLWFLEQLTGPSAVHNVPVGSRLRGPLNMAALQHSLNELVARHAALRTTFPTCEGRPTSLIAAHQTVALSVVDLGQQLKADAEVALATVLATESRRPFDTGKGPLLRAMVVRMDDLDHALLITLHGMVCDGWSLDVLMRDASELYAASVAGRPASLPELRLQYATVAASQRERFAGAEVDRLVGYWRAQLESVPLVLELPCDRPRPPVASPRGAGAAFNLPAPLVSALRNLSQTHDATLFMTLLAGFGALLGRYTNQDPILVGSAIACRSRPELENVIGLLANTLTLRIDLFGNPTCTELLRRVRDMTLGAYDHQELPFEKLVDVLQPQRDLAHHPVVQVMFGLHDGQRPSLQPIDVTSAPIDLPTGTSRVDLDLRLSECESGLEGWLEYDADLFDQATIERFIGHYELLLSGIVAHPELPISELPLSGENERRQMLVDWNATETDYPRTLCVHQLVEAQVDRTPDAIAVVGDDGTLSYVMLDALANQLAHYLTELGVRRGDLVALSLDRTTAMLVALLAISKAGAGYLPLDPMYPKERQAFMLADSGVRLLLTQRTMLAQTPASAAVRVICLDAPDERLAIAAHSKTRPEVVGSAVDVAYVIYTSGSTGQPKGVSVQHRALVNLLVSARRTPGITSNDVVLAITTLAFDIAAYDLWAPLTVGARLALASHEAAGNGRLLLDLLSSSGATILQATPPTWRLLIEAGWRGGSGLKVISTGEALPPDLAAQLVSRADDVWNMYGPTETTVWSAYWQVPNQAVPILIGRPMANTRLYILDASRQPVPIGVPGELYIGGDGVARGYLGQPQLTSERFLPDPFARDLDARMYRTGDVARWRLNGQIEYLGRNDDQVKLRGCRLEPGEIEARLREHPSVRDAGVLVRADTPGDPLLIAFIVHRAGAPPPESAELRAFVRRRLPEYMVPAAFVPLDALPLTVSGKIDRKALATADPGAILTAAGYVGPRDRVESCLVALWEDLLGVAPIGIHDNFFDVGGQSLLAARLVFRIESELGRNLPVAVLMRADTVALLAELIRAPEEAEIWDPLVELQRGAPGRRPLFLVHGAFGDVLCYLELARALGAQQGCYVLQAIGLDGVHPPQDRVEDMAAAYILQMRAVQPFGPYCLAGYSLGGIIVYEMARQLKAAGDEIALLAVFDHAPSLGHLSRRPPLAMFSARFTQHLVTNIPHWTRKALEVKPAKWTAVLAERARLARRAFSKLLHARAPSVEEAVREVEEVSGLNHLADWPEYRRRVLQYQFRAVRAYEVQPYEGELLLFRARRQPLVSPHDPRLGWGELIRGPIDVIHVPGNHQELLHEPHVLVVAAALRARLEALAV